MKLEELNFVWSLWEHDFNLGLDYLKEFISENGHAWVPTGCEIEGFKLGSWVAKKREAKKNGYLNPDWEKILNELNFIWAPKQKEFEIFFERLCSFYNEHKHTRVPQHYVDETGFMLGRKVSNIPKSLKKNQISGDKIELLNQVQFIWDTRQEDFEEGYHHLLEFISENGNARVPSQYLTTNGFKLGKWVLNRRKGKIAGWLSDAHYRKLEEAAFIWDTVWFEFEQTLDLLKEFKKENEHVRVPARYITSSGINLGVKAANLRKSWRKGILTADKIKSLEDIRFIFDPMLEDWNKGYKTLCKFQSKEGHCLVGSSIKQDGYYLGQWVSTQRKRKNKLTLEQIKRLDDLGFVWQTD